MSTISAKRISQWFVFIGFLLLILAGGAVLSLDLTHKTPVSFIDALFTSTSAVCVTGLLTVPTSSYSIFGHVTLLILIQLGGLGIMSFTSGVVLLLRGELNLKERMITAGATDTLSLRDLEGLLVLIVKYTLVVEAIGAILLFPGFLSTGKPVGLSAYLAVFHAVSAFCNAGFSPFDSSLIGLPAYIKIVIAFLVMLGGIGFYVVYNLNEVRRGVKRISLHSRLVLYFTVALVLGGAALIFLFEKGSVSPVDAFFQAVTCRSAGFVTTDIMKLHNSTLLLMILLMLVGAAPGSTGGGIKTNVVMVIILSVKSFLTGHRDCVAFGRRISAESIRQCYAFMTIYLAAFVCIALCLMVLNPLTLQQALFESASGLGTTGISLKVTPNLTMASKFLMMAVMFIGRLGPAFCVLMFVMKEKQSKVSYVDEKVILG